MNEEAKIILEDIFNGLLNNDEDNIDFLNNEIKLYSYRGIRGRDGESDERYFEK